ncbi:MAG: hypothetical protein PHN88_13365 [Ignavibacteria bacterium]|nr:hypothetical protein [Ignavibacteria bacterium]
MNAASNQNKSLNYVELEQKLKYNYFPILQEDNYYLFSSVKTPIDRECETVTLGIAGLIIPLNNFDINKSYKKSNIGINITSDKSEYSLLEPVWITVQFKNTGANVDSIDVFGELELYPKFLV